MRSLILSVFLFFSVASQAQQYPVFVSEGFTSFWNNPASFGSWNKFSFNAVGSLQWVGIESAPRSIMINAEHGVDFETQSDSWKNVRFGYGINVIVENVGFQNNFIFTVPLNYQIKIKESFLSIGIAPGFRKLSFDPSWVPPSPGFTIPPSPASFNIDAGLFWFNEKAYAGISSTRINRPHSGSGGVRHYYVQGGYRFKIGQHYIFPQVHIAANSASTSFWNINYFQFKEDIFSVGLGFSYGSEILFAATARYKFLKLAYNYDLVMNPLSSYTSGSHQLRLSFIIDKAGKNKEN